MNDGKIRSDIDSLVLSLSQTYELKSIRRSGWIQSGIPESESESIASHSYGMTMLLLYLRSELLNNGINMERALSMAAIHDLAEVITGDITPQDKVPLSDKYLAEKSAFEQIINDVQNGEYLIELWKEYESGLTKEAQVVKRMDKLDMLIQAYLYEHQYEMSLDSFWLNMSDLFLGSESEEIYNYIRLNRFEVEGK